MEKTWHWHLPRETAVHRMVKPGQRRELPPIAKFRHPATPDAVCHRLMVQCAGAIAEGQHPRVNMLDIVKIRLRERDAV